MAIFLDVMPIFLDLKLAFDTVDHTMHIEKLDALGIRAISGAWFTFFSRRN